MRTPTPFILLLVLLVSGCSTTDDDGNFSESQKEAAVTGSTRANEVTTSNSYLYARRSYAPEPVKIEPALNRIAFRSYRVPVLAREDRFQKANVMKGLISDLGLVVDGKLELSEVAEAFVRFTDRYEQALEGTVGYYEGGILSASESRTVTNSSAYESAVKQWMAVSGGGYDQASFERWARSLLQGYRLDLPISDPVTADENFRQEVENYLW
jgi:hypothetical protein